MNMVDRKLILDIPIPPGATKDQVAAHIKEILLATSDLHIAHFTSRMADQD
jgi:hypothetical protein